MTFAAPIWLYLSPLFILGFILLLHHSDKVRRKLLHKFAAQRLANELMASHSLTRRRFKQGLLVIALACICIALARPQFGHTWQEARSRGVDIIFAVDVSRSMLAEDVRPNRLSRTKFAILDFIDILQGDRLGLVAFAGEAFLQCPPTLDYGAFRQSLEAVDTDIISLQGTDISRAIEEAMAAFTNEENHRIIILVSDGEDHEGRAIAAAERAARAGITLYSVGVGTAEGAPIPVTDRHGRRVYHRDAEGQVVHTRLMSADLEALAEVTGGFYLPLGRGVHSLEEIYHAGIAGLPGRELTSQLQRIPLERFQWPLGLALLLLAWEPILSLRRRKKRTAVVPAAATASCLLLLLAFSPAAEARGGVPAEARARYNAGVELYQQGEYEAAAKAFAEALNSLDLGLSADAFYNLGHSRFRRGLELLEQMPPGDAAEALDESNRQVLEAIRHGREIADAAAPAIGQESDDALPEELKQIIQQALQFSEQSRDALDEAKQETDLRAQQWQQVREQWQQALRNWDNAAELQPDAEDVLSSRDSVQQEISRQETQRRLDADNLQRLEQDFTRNRESIERVIEDLRKLLPPEEQPPSGEDGEEGQQDDDNQGEGQGDQGQTDDSQADGESQPDSSQQDEPGSPDSDGATDPGSGPDQHPQPRTDGDDPQTEELSDANDMAGNDFDPSRPEQHGDQSERDGTETEPDRASDPDSGDGEPISPETPDQESSETDPSPTDIPAGEDGAMSREDARRLLDSMGRNEKKLPATHGESTPRRILKDW